MSSFVIAALVSLSFVLLDGWASWRRQPYRVAKDYPVDYPVVRRISEVAVRMNRFPNVDEPLVINASEVREVAEYAAACKATNDSVDTWEGIIREGRMTMMQRKVLVLK
jgi:hypothetical protein